MKSLRMIAADSLSLRAAISFVLQPAARSCSSASADVNRSSCKKTGNSSERANFRPISSALPAASPSMPSSRSGQPMTRACASNRRTKSRTSKSRRFQFDRRSGSSLEMATRVGSDTATPIRFRPRSSERMGPDNCFSSVVPGDLFEPAVGNSLAIKARGKQGQSIWIMCPIRVRLHG